MSDLYLRLEVNDEKDQAFVVMPNRKETLGLGCTLRKFNKSQLSYEHASHDSTSATGRLMQCVILARGN